MGEGSDTRTIREKTVSLDGIKFELKVLRDEQGTIVTVKADECRPEESEGGVDLVGFVSGRTHA